VLFLVRVDLWWWRDPRLVLGLPIGFAYHLVYCVVVSLFFWWVVRACWPSELEELDQSQPESIDAEFPKRMAR